MQGNPFAPTTITAVDIQKISDRIDKLEATFLSRIDDLEKKIMPIVVPSTSTVLPTTGLSDLLPTPTVPADLSSIFPKQGGARKTMRRKNRRRKLLKQRIL
jgi:hypothetical protein